MLNIDVDNHVNNHVEHNTFFFYTFAQLKTDIHHGKLYKC